MEQNYIKEVYFDQYCPKCEHKDLKGDDEPCNACLTEPALKDTHKPLYFKEK